MRAKRERPELTSFQVLQKKPKVHQFGHVHDDPQTIEYNGTLFLNAAVDLLRIVRCFEVVV